MALKLRNHPMEAALANAQLSRLEGYLDGREVVAAWMRSALRDVPGIDVPHPPSHARPAWCALPLRYDSAHFAGLPVERFLDAVHAEGAGEIDVPGSTRALGDHPLFHTPGVLLPGTLTTRAPPPTASPTPVVSTAAR